tara:strand:+ start:867 stop:1196 length:330 start_codon:yes stop_codon:yes gene_type:complete
MKVKWEAFAKRRKYNLEMFQTLSYEEYSAWCDIRDVEPVSKEAYEGVQTMLTKEEAKPTSSTVTFDTKELKKMRKHALVELSIKNNVQDAESKTKNELIKSLVSLNNDF